MDFVFFSKLLPLLLYPLGLACLLLAVSLLLWWWKLSRWFPLPVVVAFALLWIAGNEGVSNLLVTSLEWQYINTPDNIPPAEAIVILGGGIKPPSYPRFLPDLAESGDRIIYGAQLYHLKKAPLILVTGGRIPWKEGGKEYLSEADDMANLLLLLNIPQQVILKEGQSLNTYQNAVYTKEILQKRGISRIILVTSALHMPRAVKIFEKQGFEVIPAPTDYLVTFQDFSAEKYTWQNLLIGFFPDAEYLYYTTCALKEYIGLFIYKLQGYL